MIGCKGKAELRKEWAKKKLSNMQETKQKARTHRQVDISRGRYKLPFKILEDQGGPMDPEAVKGFRNIVEKCLKMGYPFVKRHWQSARLQFLEFEEEINNRPRNVLGYNTPNDHLDQLRAS